MPRHCHFIGRGAIGLVLLLCGCAPWSPEVAKKSFELPRPQVDLEAAALDVTFVRLPAQSEKNTEGIWAEIDEQVIPAQVHKRLLANGIRCGVVGMQLPAGLREILPAVAPDAGGKSDAPQPYRDDDQGSMKVRQLFSQTGKRGEILAAENLPQLTVLVSENGEIRGETYRDAQCVLGLRTFPQGDGRVRLELTPEIDHGDPKQRVVSQEGAFRMISARDQQVFEWLKLAVLLAPGQTLVLGATDDFKGLGGQFFADRQHTDGRRLLLVRLARSSGDELLRGPSATPLATPVD